MGDGVVARDPRVRQGGASRDVPGGKFDLVGGREQSVAGRGFAACELLYRAGKESRATGEWEVTRSAGLEGQGARVEKKRLRLRKRSMEEWKGVASRANSVVSGGAQEHLRKDTSYRPRRQRECRPIASEQATG